MTLDTTELLRGFFLHVLPKGFVRICHFGLLANRFRHQLLLLARRLLAVNIDPLPEPAQDSAPDRSTLALPTLWRTDARGAKTHGCGAVSRTTRFFITAHSSPDLLHACHHTRVSDGGSTIICVQLFIELNPQHKTAHPQHHQFPSLSLPMTAPKMIHSIPRPYSKSIILASITASPPPAASFSPPNRNHLGSTLRLTPNSVIEAVPMQASDKSEVGGQFANG